MTAAIPLVWRYHARSLASAGKWPFRAALIGPLLIAAVAVLRSGGDAFAYQPWFSDYLLPLLGAAAVTAALWPEMRSGALRAWAAAPGGAGFRWALQRSALALAAVAASVLAGSVLGSLLLVPLGVMPQPAFDPGVPAGYLFTSALALAGTLLFRHPMGGLALAVGYWLVDLWLGLLGNPLLTLHAASGLDRYSHSPLGAINKPALFAAAIGLVAWCAAAMPRLAQPVERREWPGLTGRLLGGFCVLLLGQAVVGVGVLYVSRGPAAPIPRGVYSLAQHGRSATVPTNRPSTLRGIGAPLERFNPLPLSLLFGPVYHGLVQLPPASTARPSRSSEPGPRLLALARLVRDYGSWPWGDTAAYELAIERSAIDGVAGLQDYWNVAQRYPKSPYAPDALATVMNTTDVWVVAERGPSSIAGGFDRTFQRVPLQPRLSAALTLLERYPNSPSAKDAREMVLRYYPALIRPEAVILAARNAAARTRGEERARWLAILAEIDVNAGRYAEAEKTLKQARDAAGRAPARPDAEEAPGSTYADYVQRKIDAWRDRKQEGEP